MSARLSKLLALLALVATGFASGVHVAVLQTFAWARMFSEYRTMMPAGEALAFTFSGRELCGVCLAADAIRSDMDETAAAFFMSTPSVMLIPGWQVIKLAPPATDCADRRLADILATDFSTAPPEPPPPKQIVA